MTAPASTIGAAAAGALIVGISGSVHCLLMCGPLACATLPLERGPARRRAKWSYQAARVGAYALMGGLLGGLGGGVGRLFSVSVQPWLPWIMAAGLVASALELGKRLRPLPGVSKAIGWVGRASARLSPSLRAGAMGALTPLLPCGLLYGIMAAALASGSFLAGGIIMGAFAIAGLPMLVAAQVGAGLWRTGRRPLIDFAVRRAVPLAAAVVLVYRAVMAQVESGAPACH